MGKKPFHGIEIWQTDHFVVVVILCFAVVVLLFVMLLKNRIINSNMTKEDQNMGFYG